MKRLSLAIILACCTLAVAAQEGIQVKYQGAKPTIRDFAQAYLYALFNPEDGEEPEGDGLYLYESLQQAIASQDKKLPLKKGTTLTIDLRNGVTQGFLLTGDTHSGYHHLVEGLSVALQEDAYAVLSLYGLGLTWLSVTIMPRRLWKDVIPQASTWSI